MLDDATSRLITLYKDGGERGLHAFIACCMGNAIPPHWLDDDPLLTYIPDTGIAVRRRGFDHGLELAKALGTMMGTRTVALFNRPKASDQRKLTRAQRFANMTGALTCTNEARNELEGRTVIVSDDVFTTGATLNAAAKELAAQGATEIRCVTLGRVY